MSEYAPRFGAKPWTFVKRNATIAALAEAVVVVEAGERSGALIASGAARAYVDADGLLGALGHLPPIAVTAPGDPILDALAAGALDVDALRRRVRMAEGDLADRLLRLTLAGRVMQTPDGRYRGR